MEEHDYENAVSGAVMLSKKDVASIILRLGEEGSISVGAYGDIRGIDILYERICRAYLLTLSQEVLDEFIDSTTLGLK